MSAFRMMVMLRREDPETRHTLNIVCSGTPQARTEALSSLVRRAERSSDPDDWNAVGVGLHHAGEHDSAIGVFEGLVRSFPHVDAYRFNLATSYSQLEQIGLCRHHLQHLAAQAATQELRNLAEQQLRGYEKFLGMSPEDQALRVLQLRSLRRAIDRTARKPEDFVALARLLIQHEKLEPNMGGLDEALEILERGHAAFPEDVSLLEHLIACYLRCDPKGRLDAALKELARLAPESAALHAISRIGDDDASAFSDQIHKRTERLFQVVADAQGPEREAALKDLSSIVSMYPENEGYRLNYAFALMACGMKEAAIEQARHLASLDVKSHTFQFNLGQVFWLCGDAIAGRRHLELAYHFASTEEERRDAEERISELGKQQ
jgi:tetratricopeptide (TPR) repeat protein